MNRPLRQPLSHRWAHFAIYSLAFVAVFALCYQWFAIEGKSLVWKIDGARQHYTAFVYLGEWIRSIVTGSIASGSLTVPLFDFSIGYGSDIVSTFSYYGLGEPLVWLSALCPSRYAEYLYSALIVVRLYLAGLSFLCFTRYLKLNPVASTIGSIAYVFSYWGLSAGIRHPFFLVPLIFLPLCLLGAEKILRKEKPTCFIVSTFLAALCSFYFFYMLFIAIFLYVLLRFVFATHDNAVREFAHLFLRFLLYGVTAFMMAGVLMGPVLCSLAASSRSGAEILDSAYSLTYYEKLFSCALITPTNPGNWAHIGVSAPSILGTVLLFVHKGHRELKVGIILMIAALCLPEAGRALNGMSFASNRWCWMLVFAVCLALPVMWEHILKPKKRDTIAVALFFVIALVLNCKFEFVEAGSVVSAITLLGISVFVLMETRMTQRRNRPEGLVRDDGAQSLSKIESSPSKKEGVSPTPRLSSATLRTNRNNRRMYSYCSIMLATLIVVGCGLNAYYRFDSSEFRYAKQFVDAGKAAAFTKSNDAVRAKNAIDEKGTFERFESTSHNNNIAMSSKMPSVGFYWSLCNGTISDYLIDMSVNEVRSFAYYGLNQRTFLEELANVGYFSGPEANKPYGFERIGKTLSENQSTLPFGYTYDSSIDPDTYKSLNPLQKQETLMQSVVFNDGDSGLPTKQTINETNNHPYSVTMGNNVKSEGDNKFVAGKAGAKITINADCPKGEEVYLYLKGVNVQAKTLYSLYHDDDQGFLSQSEYDALPAKKKKKLKDINKDDSDARIVAFEIPVSCEKTKSYFQYWSPYSSHYAGQHDFAICLGTSDRNRSSITVTFPTPGVYDLGEMTVSSQPMDNYQSYVNKLSSDTLENVSFDTNRVSGTISLDQRKALLLSIPYSDGWTARIDGEPAQIHQANGMFMGLTLEPGSHEIELTYQTKGLIPGMICSIVGFALFAAITFFERRTHKPKERAKPKS